MRKNDRIKRVAALFLILALIIPQTAFAAGSDSNEIQFDRVLNARDLGGYKTKDGHKVKKGVLIRSGELSYASKGDLNKLKKQYKVKKVIDFRYKFDFKYCPDKRISGAKYINIPAKYKKTSNKKSSKKRYKSFKKKGNKKLRQTFASQAGKTKRSYTYQLVMSSYSQKQYRKYFNELLNNKNGDGVLIHCIFGKDRTGVAAFMTLIALGVDEETAYKEYARTNSCLNKYNSKKYKKGRIGVKEKDLRYAVKAAKKKYGSLDNFLKKAYGLDDSKIKTLKKIYTE